MSKHVTKEPKISCLCLTKNGIPYIRNAIRCFKGQTYLNKELVIVYQGANKKVINYLRLVSRKINLKAVLVPNEPKLSMGELRNISIKEASGDYFCTWDDDDWYHCDRLKIQIGCIINNFHTACILNYIFIYDRRKKQAYFSRPRLWENSLLCKRDVYPVIKFPDVSKSEDSIFVYQIIRQHKVFPIVYPGLYIYVFHGKNTSAGFFQKNLDLSQKLSKECSQLISRILQGKFPIKKASRLLHSRAILNEINYLYTTKILLLQQDIVKQGNKFLF